MHQTFTPLIYVYQHNLRSERQWLLDVNHQPIDNFLTRAFEKYLAELPEIDDKLVEKILHNAI